MTEIPIAPAGAGGLSALRRGYGRWNLISLLVFFLSSFGCSGKDSPTAPAGNALEGFREAWTLECEGPGFAGEAWGATEDFVCFRDGHDLLVYRSGDFNGPPMLFWKDACLAVEERRDPKGRTLHFLRCFARER